MVSEMWKKLKPAPHHDDFKQKENWNSNKHSGQVNIGEGLVPDARLWLAEFWSWRFRSQGRSCTRQSTKLFGCQLQQKPSYNSHGIKTNKRYAINCSIPPPEPGPAKYRDKGKAFKVFILYKHVAMDKMINMVVFLLLNLLQINLVELFNNMRQDMYIICVINISHLKMFYKIIEWFILILAPILWIGLMIMAKKAREILFTSGIQMWVWKCLKSISYFYVVVWGRSIYAIVTFNSMYWKTTSVNIGKKGRSEPIWEDSLQLAYSSKTLQLKVSFYQCLMESTCILVCNNWNGRHQSQSPLSRHNRWHKHQQSKDGSAHAKAFHLYQSTSTIPPQFVSRTTSCLHIMSDHHLQKDKNHHCTIKEL